MVVHQISRPKEESKIVGSQFLIMNVCYSLHLFASFRTRWAAADIMTSPTQQDLERLGRLPRLILDSGTAVSHALTMTNHCRIRSVFPMHHITDMLFSVSVFHAKILFLNSDYPPPCLCGLYMTHRFLYLSFFFSYRSQRAPSCAGCAAPACVANRCRWPTIRFTSLPFSKM